MPVKVVEMQSEAGAAGTVHGSLMVGALTTTFTASQGLLLKIPNMYKIAGELLPGVMHVAARSLAAHSLSIFGDHQDIYAARPTGWCMLASGSVQEVMDLGGIAHLAAIKSSLPFMHFFDGFRTSHEVNKIEVMDYSVYDRLLDREAVKKFRERALNSSHPVTKGTAQNDDVYFQAKEVQSKYYVPVADIVNDYMKEISKETGRSYAPFSYYGAKDAERVIIAMGSVTDTIREVVDYLTAQGEKVGLLAVHLYRPFSAKYFFNALPKTVSKIAVLDRTKEPGATGEPLYLDVKSLFYDKENRPEIVGGRYGLSSKDTTPDQIFAVYKNLNGKLKDQFTIGIVDDVMFSNLELVKSPHTTDPDTTELLFFGLGSDGTVGAVKNVSKIIGDYTNLYGQAYASYDSKKSGGVTRMHLRFGKSPIRSTYLVNNPHFVSCSQDSYLSRFEIVGGIRKDGIFLLSTSRKPEEIEELLPNNVKRDLAKAGAKLYIIHAYELAKEIGEVKLVSTIMLSAFILFWYIIVYTFFATCFPNKPRGLNRTITRMIPYTTAFSQPRTTNDNNPVNTGIIMLAISGPANDPKPPKIAAINPLTWVGVIKPTSNVAVFGAQRTAATPPNKPAIPQLNAVITFVLTPIILATTSLEAVALTPNPHLVNLSIENNMTNITTVMIKANNAFCVMLSSIPNRVKSILSPYTNLGIPIGIDPKINGIDPAKTKTSPIVIICLPTAEGILEFLIINTSIQTAIKKATIAPPSIASKTIKVLPIFV